jgi:protein SCO1/2
MRVRRWAWLGLALLTCGLTPAGCGGQETPRTYELQGQILAIQADTSTVLIKHGDIAGFMPGMTMPFRVRDARLLAGKAPGDLVTARLMVGSDDAWLDTLEKTGAAPLAAEVASPAASFVTPLAPGDAVPDAQLVDSTGRDVAIRQWQGRPYALTFMYIRCPLPQFCPLLDRRFRALQDAIQADAGLNGRARLLSISFDPEFDTPEALGAHARKLGADSAVWSFATAPPTEIDRFAATFGVNVIREADRTITHNLRTAVVGSDGRILAIYDGSDWTVDRVLDDLRRAR